LFKGKLALIQYFAIQSLPKTSTFDIDDLPVEVVNDISAPKKSGMQ
jgi:hypothetical protein